jgi:hypothetical protein
MDYMNENIKGTYISTYFDLVMKEVRTTLPFKDDEDRFGLGQAIMNVVTQAEPTVVVNKKYSRRDKFVANKIFAPMSEILTAIWSIDNIAVYVRTFPHKKQNISHLSYLRYHVENYLNEIYILQTRLIAYLNILEKAYRKSTHWTKILEITEPLSTFVYDALKSYNDVRGTHVHVTRFSDKEFKRLATLDLLSKGDDDFNILMKSEFLSSYRSARKKWSDKIVKDSVDIRKLLDVYFEVLTKVLFSEEHLIIPENYK